MDERSAWAALLRFLGYGQDPEHPDGPRHGACVCTEPENEPEAS